MLKRSRLLLRKWGPLIAYLCLIHLQSSRPSIVTEHDFPHFDKLLHFCGYALLGALFARAYETLPFLKRRWAWILLAVLSGATYGVVDEIHQSYVPFRDGSVADALFDGLGALTGAALWARLSALSVRPLKNNGGD